MKQKLSTTPSPPNWICTLLCVVAARADSKHLCPGFGLSVGNERPGHGCGFEKVCCIINKDEYDLRWGQWLEYGYESEDEYYKIKEFMLSRPSSC